MQKSKIWHSSSIAAFSGLLAVTLGAMGAHALKPYLSDYQLDIFEKAVFYQFVHTLALLAVALFEKIKGGSPKLRWASISFTIGIICFSGSLYFLACADLLPFSVRWAGPITPIGGLFFMAGWLLLLVDKEST